MPVLQRPRLFALATAVAATTAGLVVPAAPAAAVVPVLPAAAASAAQQAPARAATRLTITITSGPRPVLTGVLSRRAGGRVPGRALAVWVRVADTGVWRRVRVLTASSRGVIRYRVVDRPGLQFTLRFAGDRRHGPAASPTLVPLPTARGLDRGLVTALASARAAARRAGYSLVVNSGYRTRAQQQALYDAGVRRYGSARAARRWVLPAAESTHVRGLAVDIGSPAAAAWLGRRGARWGLCRAYAGEPWHFEHRPDWVRAYGGRCPPPVATPGDPDPVSPRPRVPVS